MLLLEKIAVLSGWMLATCDDDAVLCVFAGFTSLLLCQLFQSKCVCVCVSVCVCVCVCVWMLAAYNDECFTVEAERPWIAIVMEYCASSLGAYVDQQPAAAVAQAGRYAAADLLRRDVRVRCRAAM